ncbi:MAG: PH domain-containing protein [Clostridiaceae bacterium]|nr:PH domain-containing protein [Eubacteriales bacterium]
MGKKAEQDGQGTLLWHDRKRILGMPLSFTKYEIDESRLTVRKGLFRTETDELLLYRVLDIKMVRTLGQKLVGVGTLKLYCADQSNGTLELKSIKKPEAVRKFLSRIVEQERNAKGVTGREIYGMTNLHVQADGLGHDFVDADGDGIPG